MPEDLLESKGEGEAPAPRQDLFGIGLVLAVMTFLVSFVVALLISPLYPARLSEAIPAVFLVDGALVVAEIIAGVVLRTAFGRVVPGNALLIASLVSAAFLAIVGILKGAC